jgi:hypothetical protein
VNTAFGAERRRRAATLTNLRTILTMTT